MKSQARFERARDHSTKKDLALQKWALGSQQYWIAKFPQEKGFKHQKGKEQNKYNDQNNTNVPEALYICRT